MSFSRTRSLCFVASLLAGGLAQAEEAPSASMQLLEVMDYEENTRSMTAKAFDVMFEQMRAQGIADEAIEEITTAANTMARQAFVEGDVVGKMATLYEQRFTEEEIKALITFYSTPLGKKLLREQTPLAEAGMKIGMEAFEKHQAQFQQDVVAIIQKYQQTGADPAPEGTEAPSEPQPSHEATE